MKPNLNIGSKIYDFNSNNNFQFLNKNSNDSI